MPVSCGMPQCSPWPVERTGTSVTKTVRDCSLSAAAHTLTLCSRTESFYFDICMSFGCCTPQPVCVIDYLDPRLKLCMRPDGCPDVALYRMDGCHCLQQGEGAVLDWDGACRKLTLRFSPCLNVEGKKFILRLHVRPRTGQCTIPAEVINRCTLHTGDRELVSNAVMVRIPGACPPCMKRPWKECWA